MIRGTVIFSLLISLIAGAEPDPKPGMRLLLEDVRALEQYLVSESQFFDKSNEGKITATLGNLSAHLAGMKKDKKLFQDDLALRANLQMIEGHVGQASEFFRENNKHFARYMLQSSLQMCISCHSRGSSSTELFLDSQVSGASEMEQAEFYFATRQFSKAKKTFEALAQGFPGNKIGASGLRRVLLNLAVLHTRVEPNPTGAAAFFEKISGAKEIPQFMQQDLLAWVKDLKTWQKEKPMAAGASDSELLVAAKKLLKSDDMELMGDFERRFHIRRLRASVYLHKLLETPGVSPAKGEALYLLGLIYNRINHNLFFRFDDMYLRTCIQEFKKTKIARDCYVALERITLDGFTGSAGTNLPQDVEVELFQLKRLAY